MAEADRLDALRGYGVLDTAPEEAFDRITRLAADLFDAPVAVVSLLDKDREWFKSRTAALPAELERASSFCSLLLDLGPGEILVIPDAAADPVLAGNPSVAAGHVRFFVAAPLVDVDGHVLGGLCVVDCAPHAAPSARDLDRLKTLAAIVTDELGRRRQMLQKSRAEQGLRLLQTALDQANDAVVIMEEPADGRGPPRIVSANAAFLNDTGYTKDEVIGLAPDILCGPETDPEHIRAIGEAAAAKRRIRIEILNYRKDGSSLWSELDISPVRDETGRHSHTICIQRNISERRAAERDRMDRERLLSLSEKVGDMGHWRIDLRTLEVEWSQVFHEIYGREFGAFTPTLQNTIDAFIPEHRPIVAGKLEQAILSGAPFEFELRIQRPDGDFRDVACRAIVETDPSGAVLAVFGVLQDVSVKHLAEEALRDSEMRYRMLADHATDVISRLSFAGERRYVSASVFEVLGYRTDELYGGSSLSFTHPDDRPEVGATLAAMEQGLERRMLTHRAITRDGRQLWVETIFRLVRHPDTNEPLEVLASLRDITARKELEDELLTAKERAEAGARTKAAFLANMSHEIRTPMNGVMGFADLLMDTPLSDQQRRYLGHIQDASAALLRLINDILDFSKIEAGRLELVCEPFNLQNALEQSVQLVGASAQQKNLVIEAEMDPGLPMWIVGDSLRLRQIVLNVLGNAVKFTGEGVVTVTARGDRVRGLELQVVDTGPGIPQDRLAGLFDEFVQADPSIAASFGGTGLGLSISRRLARLMGGDLTLESVEGLGTTVTLTLPLQAAESREASSETAADAPAPAAAEGERPVVLVVDDLDINRELVSIMLSKADIDVECVADGLTAVERVASRPYDLVLMDVRMPGIDGLEAVRRIRAAGGQGAAIPILALTADAMPEQIQACLVAGMNDCVSKPVNAAELLTKVSAWLVQGDVRVQAPEASAEEEQSLERRALHSLFVERLGLYQQHFRRLAAATPSDRSSVELTHLAHTLAGSAGHFGFPDLGEAAKALLHALERGADPEGAAALQARMDTLLAMLDRLIEVPGAEARRAG